MPINAVKKSANLEKIAKVGDKNFFKNRKHTANKKNRQKRGPKESPTKDGEFSSNVLNIC